MKFKIVCLMVLLTMIACHRKNVVVRGTIEGGQGSSIVLERLDVSRTTLIDSTKVRKNGGFSFSTELMDPELFVLKANDGKIINLLLFPGDQVSVTTSVDSFSWGYTVEGSDESENIRILVEQMASTRAEMDSLLGVAETIPDSESPQMDLIRSAYTRAIVRQKRFTIRFLVEHMTSLSSVYALYQKFDEETPVFGQESDLQYFKAVADSLEPVYPNSSLTRSLKADIERRETEFQQLAHIRSLLDQAGEETGSPDLSIPDRDGHEIALSSLKGKVVLLAFWASGNEESVRALLRLRSTYNRYHPLGFEIYAISLDTDKIRWMSSVDFNEFDWINVSELNYPDSKANIFYNVTELPSVFLVDRQGDIVAKNLYGRTLETWLDNLL